MKRFALVFLLCLLWAVQAQAVLVLGYAYLSGQQNHADIRVIFEAVSPSAQTDTVYTSEFGVFSATLEPGVYNVLYSHASYANYNLPNQVLLWNTNLDPVILMPPLSGYLSGTLGPGDFQVVDSIVVANGQSLTIQPGTRLFFNAGKRFYVYGLLQAIGTQTDSILFTRRTPSPDSLWGGLRFSDAAEGNRLEYCAIEYAGGSAFAGVFIDSCDPTIRFSSVRSNFGSAGGIECISSGAQFENCLVTGNQGTLGGIACGGGAPHFTSCEIVGNTSNNNSGGVYTNDGSQAHFVDCLISQNFGWYGGGIGAHSGATFERCVISGNTSSYYAGGISSGGGSSFVQCLITRNHSEYGAGGVQCGNATFQRCTITGNTTGPYGYRGDAVYFTSSTAVFSSCILASGRSHAAIFFSGSNNAVVRYCDIFAGDSAAIGFADNDPANGPLVIGVRIITNPNGDSCDTYYNIFADPQFVDTANGDYHLPTGSPCIDAGDPALGPDPDGTVADIGAFYFDQMSVGDKPFIVQRSSLIAYPNPFNSTTEIVFEMPKASRAEIAVYDITGRLVRTLFSGTAAPGRNVVSFSGDELPSGLYFCRLTAGDFRQTRKLVLIK